jgi:RNA polymerase sigma-70 factor (ECF subfamily)
MLLAKNKDLLERFRAGDKDAMDEVYRHYSPGVTRFLRQGFTFRSGGGHCYFKGIKLEDDLKSAVQEVFRRAFEDRARNAYNGINSFSNWVLAISRNMVINGFRNREIAISAYISKKDDRGHLAIMDNSVTENYTGILYGQQNQDQEKTYEHTELKGLIGKFMAELSEQERKLLVLRFIDGVGQEEAAQKLDSSRMKVRTAEAKLRRRLRAYLKNSGYIDNIAEKND